MEEAKMSDGVHDKLSTTAESVGAGAVGGAALGSVVGLGIAIGSLAIPVIGAAAGALGGAMISWLCSTSDKEQKSGIQG
jgi:uncharacterized membrane protein